MAEAPGSLGDFFAKKKNKKNHIKGSNLNNEAANPNKVEEKKTKSKEKEEEGWEEEQIVAPTMKVEVAGKLTRDDDKKEEEDTVAPAWGTAKNKSEAHRQDLTDKKFPTLAKAVQSSNINIDDGSEPKVNIKTTKNKFAALEDNDPDEDEARKRPKEIKPAMIQKQKGEREKEAIQREVDKYSVAKKEDSKKKKADAKKKKDHEEDDDEDEEEAEEAPEEVEKETKKKPDRKQGKTKEPAPKDEVELEEDLKIEPDLAASRAKYIGRTKLPTKELPASELEAEKENRPLPAPAAGKKKKKRFDDEDDGKPKLLAAPDDWD